MADGSRYIRCERCAAVLDRRPKDDHAYGGVFRYGQEHELRTYAASLGWTRPTDETDLCPKCSVTGQLKENAVSDPVDGEVIPIEGKTIASARKGKTDAGYDYVSLLFSDGTVYRIQEEGQAGWFSAKLS